MGKPIYGKTLLLVKRALKLNPPRAPGVTKLVPGASQLGAVFGAGFASFKYSPVGLYSKGVKSSSNSALDHVKLSFRVFVENLNEDSLFPCSSNQRLIP